MKIYEFSSIEDYFLKYVNILSALKLSEDKWLSPREKQFLISCMICENKGIDMNSKRGVLFIKEKAACKNKDWYNLSKSVVDKGWLSKIKEGFKLTDAIDPNKNTGLGKKVLFKIGLVYEESK
jgi:hypothetical protein